MKVSVVQCNCGNPIPHRKLEIEDGRQSPGFSNIRRGKEILNGALKTGLQQTAEETTATIAELNACGLSEDELTGDELIEAIASGLMQYELNQRQLMVATGVSGGSLFIQEAEKVLNRLKFLERQQPAG